VGSIQECGEGPREARVRLRAEPRVQPLGMTVAVHSERSGASPSSFRAERSFPLCHSERAQLPLCHSERAQRVEESHPLSLGKRRSRGCTRIAGQDRRPSIVCCCSSSASVRAFSSASVRAHAVSPGRRLRFLAALGMTRRRVSFRASEASRGISVGVRCRPARARTHAEELPRRNAEVPRASGPGTWFPLRQPSDAAVPLLLDAGGREWSQGADSMP
jgi:hypothetical protein